MNGIVKIGPEGFCFKSEKREYSLYEGMNIDVDGKHKLTSDIIFIMDDSDAEKDPQFVGYTYGAFQLNSTFDLRKDIEQDIADIVAGYEKAESLD